MKRVEIRRVNILGVNVSDVNIDLAVQQILDWVHTGTHTYVTVTPVHGILDCLRDDNLRRVFNRSGMTTPDGMPIVWLLRSMGSHVADRVYGPDLMSAVMYATRNQPVSHYLYGGAEGVADDLSNHLGVRYPGVNIAGTYCPPFRPLTEIEDDEVINSINQSGADIVWIGLSTPKQERWMAAHLERINASVLIGVGAAFDFLSGRKPQAPRWVQRSGFEWLFRLLTEPKRLWKRYLPYPLFPILVMVQRLKLKDFPIEK